ncbi:hypothetical protein ABVT39_027084 [Epinephelus coioides]
MTTVYQILLKELKDLLDDQFKEFKFQVRECVQADGGFPVIPSSELANADRPKMVELMVQHYKDQAVVVTQAALKEIGRNDLVENLNRARNAGPMQLDHANLQ